jgi:uncharacterized protein with FMN-binding domain
MIRAQHAARAAAAAAIAAAAIGALASCSSDSATGATTGSASSDASGTWTETGDYQSPGGQESVTVTLTAKDGTVTAVKVTGSGDSPDAQQYQSRFEAGISAAVVGKPLATLEVGAVSGSSLTGNGFNAAVEKIRADAA